MKVGVFDSGIGGLAMVQAVKQELPELEVISVNDHEHIPYGDKTPEELLGFVVPILEGLVAQGCAIIVIACNTVTTTIITQLREAIPVPLVGMEPMIKPAAERTTSGVIAVCATPATLASTRYAWLKKTYAEGVRVLEPDCSQWASMIEHSQVNEIAIEAEIRAVCDQGADIIVLGCTHYHWIERTIQRMAAGKAQVVQPEVAVLTELKRQLALVRHAGTA
jgi:glutamate racemase